MAKLPKNPFHPGEILLEEFLQPMDLTQAAFAERIGWTKSRLNEVIKGKHNISASTYWHCLDTPKKKQRIKTWIEKETTLLRHKPISASVLTP